ncbi:thymidylate synthase [Nonlabens ponticola]|uniref:Thymidylate synthase n=1 Tax=Nonlabens ponticola TaxID=2496866 RepID=A0A3S9MWG3_9FLAO|nr:thymidylate synthase [Nonlabens ponticola]AZQ43453.1 thymidylate synthase [Nonlabens ponticola]
MKPNKTIEYHFGKVEYYDHYVIGRVNQDHTVDTAVAKAILTDLNSHYGKEPFVYISNRAFHHDVDISVYKLVNPRRIIGIAIITPNRHEIIPKASQEQAAYEGSFGIFPNEESAVSWAQSFFEDDDS